MDELLEGLIAKVGIDRATAEKVIAFLKEHADQVPGWLASSGLASKLPGSLGSLFGK